MRINFLKKWMVLLITLLFSLHVFAKGQASIEIISIVNLPQEAQKTLALIKQGGPFPYARDGVIFNNYQKILPRQNRGYYREYTVKTPGIHQRGARRIIAGGEAKWPADYYYTDNHYASFKQIKE